MSDFLSSIPFLQSGPFALTRWEALFERADLFWDGLLVTLIVATLGLAVALVLGIVFGVLSSAHWKVPKAIARGYVEFFQNTPLLIQVFMLYNALPIIAPQFFLPVTVIGVLGVGIYHGAYISEVVRAGIQSIGRGQLEAALSQGFTYIEAMRYVIIPQAMRIVMPPLTNQAVSLIKNTSVIAIIAGGDLMYQGDSFAGRFGHYGPAYLTVAVLYFALCFPLAFYARRLEERTQVS